ncbi:MAG: hypothetical protein ACRD88_12490, partial [Terriglobia bacterium]
MSEPPPNSQKPATLDSWKEIAAYLQRDVSTVYRWEKYEGLPIHRHEHRQRSSVYAIPAELDAWRAARQPEPEAPTTHPVHWRLAIAATIVVTLLGSGWALWRKGILRLPYPLVEAAEPGSAVTLRKVWAGPEVNTYGAPSADGRFLTYVDWATPALAIRNMVTGETRRVINGSWADPAQFPGGPSFFSPDGRKVVSLWFNEKKFEDLRVVPVNPEPDGGRPRVLYRNEEIPYPYPAEWSPDGKSILATFWKKDETTQIALISVEDGSTRVLKSLDWRSPEVTRFSPDGRYIAYDFPPKQDSAERDIFVLAADGSQETPLIQHPADDRLLGWTPDGKYILFRSDRTGTLGAWLIEVAAGRPSGQPQLVKGDLGRIQPMGFARNGSFYFGLSAGIRDIYVATLDPATGRVLRQPQLASQRFLGANRAPEWSPDGESMAYFVNLSNTGRQPTSLS